MSRELYSECNSKNEEWIITKMQKKGGKKAKVRINCPFKRKIKTPVLLKEM